MTPSQGKLFGLNTSVRVERYDANQHLKIHRDGCVRVPGTKRVHTVFAVLVRTERKKKKKKKKKKRRRRRRGRGRGRGRRRKKIHV
jgi:hypothetical protein